MLRHVIQSVALTIAAHGAFLHIESQMTATALVMAAFGVGSAVAAFLASRALASGFQHVWGPDRRTDVDPGA